MHHTHTDEQSKAEEDEPNSFDDREPHQYTLSLVKGGTTDCPVKSCPAKAKTPGEMRKQFQNRHLQDTIIVEVEGLLPQCTKCGLFQSMVGPSHQRSADCKRFTEIRQKWEQAKVQSAAKEFNFTVNGTLINYTIGFKYL